MDHYIEPQTIVDEDSQDAVVNANVAELESSQYDEPHTATTPVKEANNDNIPNHQHQKYQGKTRHRLALKNTLHHRNENYLLTMMLLKKKMSSLPL